MKTIVKFSLLLAFVGLLAGCTSTSDWCRRGSVWPFSSRPAAAAPEEFVVPSQGYCSPPCTPALCNDPCSGGSYSGGYSPDPGPQFVQ